MVGLNTAVISFFTAMLIVVLVEQSSTAFGKNVYCCYSCQLVMFFCLLGFMVSTMSPSFPVAIVIAGPVVTLLQMMGGLYANVE